jgi:hypothetical protein
MESVNSISNQAQTSATYSNSNKMLKPNFLLQTDYTMQTAKTNAQEESLLPALLLTNYTVT